MKHSTLALALLAIALLAGCDSPPPMTSSYPEPTTSEDKESTAADDSKTKSSASGVEIANQRAITQVQEDVRKISTAVYDADVATVLDYTHPKVIDLLGGRPQAETALKSAYSLIQSSGMKIESFTFPQPPTFLKSDQNQFVIVPTKTIITANNGNRAESLNYQFGVLKNGETDWKYIEGSRIKKENVHSFFPDFPSGFEFPEIYRKKL